MKKNFIGYSVQKYTAWWMKKFWKWLTMLFVWPQIPNFFITILIKDKIVYTIAWLLNPLRGQLSPSLEMNCG